MNNHLNTCLQRRALAGCVDRNCLSNLQIVLPNLYGYVIMQYLYILVDIISIVIQIYVCSIVFVIISHYLFTVSIAWARSGFDNLFPTPIP